MLVLEGGGISYVNRSTLMIPFSPRRPQLAVTPSASAASLSRLSNKRQSLFGIQVASCHEDRADSASAYGSHSPRERRRYWFGVEASESRVCKGGLSSDETGRCIRRDPDLRGDL